jgi:hypothetical protein
MTQTPDIKFYCGVGDASWNGFPVVPGRYVCVSPVYGVKTRTDTSIALPTDCDVMQDSGAFCDQHHGRLTPEQALHRQIKHAERYGYADQVTHRATYDRLVRKFVPDNEAVIGVQQTIEAARWLSRNRDETRLVITAQGKGTGQYVECVQALLPMIEEGDVLGLGGWAYTGKDRSFTLLGLFREMVSAVIPLAAAHHIKAVHVWGVLMPAALGALLYACDQVGIAVSTDSTGPVVKITMSDWGYGEWRDNAYQRPDDPEAFYHDRVRHIELTRAWLARFRSTPNYPIMSTLPMFKELA